MKRMTVLILCFVVLALMSLAGCSPRTIAPGATPVPP